MHKFSKFFLLLLLFHTVIRIFITVFTNLGVDEAYYFAYGLYLDWSYFDHPPMVGLLVRASTLLFNSNSELGVRMLALIIGTINLILIYKTGQLLKDNMTGFYAALLFSASFYCSIISSVFVLPDNPLTFFWLLAVYFFIQFLYAERKKQLYLIFFGIAAGMAFLSKYSALFLWLGLLLFALKEKKLKLFKNPYLYVSAIVSLSLFLPVIIWNFNNDLSSFAFHGKRIVFENLQFKPGYFAAEFFGQLFYNNPVNIFIILSSMVFFLKNKKQVKEPAISFLFFVSLPVIVTVLFISFFNRTLPHWSGPGYLGLILFSAVMLREKHNKSTNSKAFKSVFLGNIFYLFIVVSGLVFVNYGIFLNSKNSEAETLGKNDISLDLYGWQQVKEQTVKMINDDLKNGQIDSNYVFITHNWFPAGHIEFYIASHFKKNLYVYGNANHAHQYLRINYLRGAIPQNTDAYFITTSRYYSYPEQSLLNKFEHFDAGETIRVSRNSKPAYNVFIYRLKKAKAEFSASNNL
ncbi:MAG: glycosyltransferase family 39 protein [Bacteroidales bacterium]|jgi:4-amino-4-deoxy-L-arabinose transferase-like glycosyltransferase|nr:glycosyltransferase family 39 protein [Bacteroidales bacterium]MDD4214739.1 glycosyltransferase family 39 protein [Bacteroidales bacterium]